MCISFLAAMCAFNSAPAIMCDSSYHMVSLFKSRMRTSKANCSISTLRTIISDNNMIKRESESSGDVLISSSGCSRALKVAIFPAFLSHSGLFLLFLLFPSVLFIPQHVSLQSMSTLSVFLCCSGWSLFIGS